MDPILQKFKGKFIEEATGLLDQLEKDLLDLEDNPDNKELIESAFRAMHTIKGVSGMYGFDFICEFTHNLESIYQAIRDKVLTFDKNVFDVTFMSIDHIRKLLSDEKLSDPENQANHHRLMSQSSQLVGKASAAPVAKAVPDEQPKSETNPSTWHILFRANEMVFFRGINIINIFSDLAKLGKYNITRLDYLSGSEFDTWSVVLYTEASEADIREIFMFIEDDCTLTCLSNQNLFEQAESGLSKGNEPSILDYISSFDKTPTEEENAQPADFIPRSAGGKGAKVEKMVAKRIPVDSEKLDHLMYLVSELITLNSQMTLATRDSVFESIWPFTERLDNLSKLFRNNALDIRLVPLSETVLRFKRLIRDLSAHLKKDIILETDGIDTELDKNTIDQLNDPLMHIIRNSIDHGIEMPEQRAEQGKPSTGTIKISASYSGSFVVIKVEDDGSGIDLDKIRQKAIDKGLIQASDKLSRQELIDLIFLPGFSTAQNLTEVSGRGVGMDVVRRKITDLRGEIKVETEKGVGTAFTLKLQQSVAIIDTLLFKVDESFFTVPISDINICFQVPSEDIIKHKHTRTIPFDDQLIPFVDIRENFHLKGEYHEMIKAVLLKNNDRQLAILTDTIVGEHQAVLKPLGKSFANEKCIAAASQLGDGKLAFMIDTNELFISIENNKAV